MYVEVSAATWNDVRLLSDKLPSWVFRGQASSTWTLATALERAAAGGGEANLEGLERWTLRQFQRRAHIVIDSPPQSDAVLEWLALIQHHGGPTRLLDFTHSLYIACFFALEFARGDAAIWGVQLQALAQANGATSPETVDRRNRRHIAAVEAVLTARESDAGIINVEPDRLNERMAIQQGLFLFPKDLNCSFMKNFSVALTSSSNIKPSLRQPIRELLESSHLPDMIKITLPSVMHYEALRDLRRMNIGADSLFPGLDGFARSMHAHVRFRSLSVRGATR